MADYGVTPEGFAAKRLSDILSESKVELSEVQDPRTGNKLNPDFDSSDPAMQLVQVPLGLLADAWMATQLAFDQWDPSKAVGPALDGIAQLNGLERKKATPTIIQIELTGTDGNTVPAGQQISDEFDTNVFVIDSGVTFDATGVATTTATAVEKGVLIVSDNTITKILTPQGGWDSVTNISTVVVGINLETDLDFELRRRVSTMAPAAAPADAVYANVANVDGVKYCRVYINNSLVADANGIPAKSQSVVVEGGDDLEIAKTILQRSGCTASFFGTTSVILNDAQGTPYDVRFTRPTKIQMDVDIVITISDPAFWPSDGIEQIQKSIVEYAVGGADAIGAEPGFNPDGFPPGEPVVVSRLYTAINKVNGHRIISVTVNGSTTEVPIAYDAVADFDESNITVTIQ